jgi:hypothetical protein
VHGSRASRIPITWLLILDLLVAALLSLALAQPLVSWNLPFTKGSHKIILMDVSTSMNARDVPPSRFTQAQRAALDLLASLGPKDAATVITFGAVPDWVGDTHNQSVQELINRVTNLVVGGVGNDLESALAMAKSAAFTQSSTFISTGGGAGLYLPADVHIYTDGAYSALSPAILAGLPFQINWHRCGSSENNQAALSISAQPVNDNQYQVFARLANYSSSATRRMVSLRINGEPRDSRMLEMGPLSEITQVWEDVPGPLNFTSVLLVGNDILPDDDSANLGLPQGGVLRVGLVTEKTGAVERALRVIPQVDLRMLKPSEYMPGVGFDLVVFQGWLPAEWPDGASLVIDPPSGSELLPIQAELRGVSGAVVTEDDPLFSGVDFNGVRWRKAASLVSIPAGFSTLMLVSEGASSYPLMLRGRVGHSLVTVLLADLASGNFPQHPAFPILLANVVQFGRGASLPGSLPVGASLTLPSTQEYPGIRLTGPSGKPTNLDSTRAAVWTNTLAAGMLSLGLIDRDGKSHPAWVGINAGSSQESNLKPGQWLVDSGKSITGAESGSQRTDVPLMPWLLGLAAIILFLEALLAWR